MINKTVALGIILQVLILSVLLIGCDAVLGGGGQVSMTLVDPTANYSSGQYVVGAFAGSSYLSGPSSATYQPVQNANTVVISGIEANTAGQFLVWIDTDGDGQFGDDMTGTMITTDGMPFDTEISADGILSLTFADKQITINTNPITILNKTAHCVWLIGGSLDTNVLRGDLYSTPGRAACNYLVGFVNGTFPNHSSMTTATADGDFPVPNFFFATPEITYDLIVLIDTNGNNIRDTGDWEGTLTGISSDGNGVAVSISQL